MVGEVEVEIFWGGKGGVVDFGDGVVYEGVDVLFVIIFWVVCMDEKGKVIYGWLVVCFRVVYMWEVEDFVVVRYEVGGVFSVVVCVGDCFGYV